MQFFLYDSAVDLIKPIDLADQLQTLILLHREYYATEGESYFATLTTAQEVQPWAINKKEVSNG